MTTTTTGRRAPGGRVKSCAAHGDFTAGCPDCRRRAAAYEAARQLERLRGLPPRHVDATGTRRRLQALARAGWSFEHLAPRLGVSGAQVSRWSRKTTVHRDTAARITRLTAELFATPGPSARSRKVAAGWGWLPLAAWDDVDDPAAVPDTGAVVARFGPRRQVHVEDIEFLMGHGETREAIAARLGVRPDAIEQALLRARRRDQTQVGVAA